MSDPLYEEDRGGWAAALHECAHVSNGTGWAHALQRLMESGGIESCGCQASGCDVRDELWICMRCATVRCGRYAHAHMQEHVCATGHGVVCGIADLSFWCYRCDAYLHHLTIAPVYAMYQKMHVWKFGVEAPVAFDGAEEHEEKM